MNKLFIFLLVSILNSTSLLSRDSTSKSYFGINFGLGYNIHNADFKRIPECPSCSPGYRDGYGFGVDLGLVYDYKLTSKLFLSGRALYSDVSGELTRKEKTTIILNTPTDGEFTHYLDSKISIIGIEPNLKYNPFKDLFINIGFNFSSILNKEYSQVEKITKPDDFGTFLDENGNNTFSRERNNYSGTLESANSIYFAPFLSLSYQLPLNFKRTLILEPELKYTYGLTNIIDDEIVPTWTINRVTAGVSIKYNKVKYEEKFEHIKNIDTIKIEKGLISRNEFKVGKANITNELSKSGNVIISTEVYKRTDTLFYPKKYRLEADLIVVGVDENGNEVQNPIFKIEEFVSNRLDPLLNYIFFDDNSSKLPSRYLVLKKEEINEFNFDRFIKDSTLGIYYNILNVIGKRLNDYQNSNLKLIGCNSNVGVEKSNLKLSEERALTIKKYLTEIWGINPERIKVERRNLPEKPSTPITELDKIEENRRVELYSDNPKILESLFIEKIDRSANPPTVKFKPSYISEIGLKNWEIIAFQESQINENFQLRSYEKNLPSEIEWELSYNQNIIPKAEEELRSLLSIEDIAGNKLTVKGNNLNIEVITIKEKRKEIKDDYEIEKFNILFAEFGLSELEGLNKNVVSYIKERIKQDSEIIIEGYADRTGNKEYNLKLSEERAIQTRESLGANDASIKGYGNSILLFDNDIPEGRFYCRSVKVIVKTKVK